ERGRPRTALVVGVADVELDVAVARARVAVVRPEQVGAAEVLRTRCVRDRDPLVVGEVRLSSQRRRERGSRPCGAVGVASIREDLLAAELGIRIAEARVIDDRSALVAEAAVRALSRPVVERGIAAADPAGYVREDAAGPGRASVDRAVVAVDADARSEWAR